MARFLGGCVGRILGLLLLVGVLVFGWYNRDEIVEIVDRMRGAESEVSPELAAQADDKLASLGEGGGVERVALRENELQSLIVYRWSGFLPPDVTEPRVQVGDGRVTLHGSVPTARFGRVAELRDIIAFLPDTTQLKAVASFVPMDSAHVALEVHEIGAAGIPVPRQLIPTILGRFRGSGREGLPSNALAVPLPPGIGGVFVSGDSLVFLASPGEGG